MHKNFFHVLWLPASMGLLIIGIDQTLRHSIWQDGLLSAYPFFVFCSICLLLHKFTKPQPDSAAEVADTKPPKKTRARKKKRRKAR